MKNPEFYKQWLEACREVDIPAITTDTAARIMAVLMENGNNEAMTHDRKFLDDVAYIQQRFHIHDMGVADGEFATLLRKYIKELQDYYEAHKEERIPDQGKGIKPVVPQWAKDLFLQRYNMKLI